MPMTLIEASKIDDGNVVRGPVIEMFARGGDLLRVMPFMDVAGGSYSYTQEGSLPGVAFRAFNEAYAESTGVINPQVEVLRIVGGDIDVDKALIKTRGPRVRSTQTEMKVKAMAGYVLKKMVKGDSITEPREFDGIQNRLTGSQIIDAGATNGGDALSLAKLDEAIDAVERAYRPSYPFPVPDRLIGRNEELNVIEAMLSRGLRECQVALLSAPAGTGKSALAGALVRRCHVRDALELGDRLGDLGLALGVDHAGGLVHDQDRGVAEDGSGDGDPLSFASGEFAGFVLQAMAEADHLQHRDQHGQHQDADTVVVQPGGVALRTVLRHGIALYRSLPKKTSLTRPAGLRCGARAPPARGAG